ncbi:mechanosensitive ion channel family protein [Riemerella columbipharyngis]|uniref:Miniconductance mechanosensitive channel n=1 Tax=Riemerella columbipharyngis TaxID=1071918 RepID=A0A1G6ZPC4_9FLAO|nr:mechanosensitive ion channel domain-containing protein [Riemerella columbipharyngis]SDE04067.1 miniconductance mechanosensitive channel [Riemerella columbipharyngis]
MRDGKDETVDLFIQISDAMHQWVLAHFPNVWWRLWVDIAVEFLFLVLLLLTIDRIFKIIFRIFYFVLKKYSYKSLIKSLYESKVTNSFANFIAIGLTSEAVYSIFYKHPKSYAFLDTIFGLLQVAAFGILYFRILKSIEKYYYYKKDFYRITTIRAITQSLKLIGYIFFIFIGVSVIFHIKAGTILGSLGAMTAVILLIFRDTILGFVTGIHVSTSKNLKVGDWIGIPKYNIEGTIEEISLLTVKILNFDKTVSTVPTYDLLSTEIKNYQLMSETNTRRIKRAIIFNIKSFKFVDEQLYERLSKINLIQDYLQEKWQNVARVKLGMPNNKEIINGPQLTNIGTFRIYALKYLVNNPNIDPSGTLLVRQLEITTQGLPLEIYCFTNDSKWERYEEIQADIFDHLLVAAKEFDLEIMQVSVKI